MAARLPTHSCCLVAARTQELAVSSAPPPAASTPPQYRPSAARDDGLPPDLPDIRTLLQIGCGTTEPNDSYSMDRCETV